VYVFEGRVGDLGEEKTRAKKGRVRCRGDDAEDGLCG
jgi:hypothetical protein